MEQIIVVRGIGAILTGVSLSALILGVTILPNYWICGILSMGLYFLSI